MGMGHWISSCGGCQCVEGVMAAHSCSSLTVNQMGAARCWKPERRETELWWHGPDGRHGILFWLMEQSSQHIPDEPRGRGRAETRPLPLKCYMCCFPTWAGVDQIGPLLLLSPVGYHDFNPQLNQPCNTSVIGTIQRDQPYLESNVLLPHFKLLGCRATWQPPLVWMEGALVRSWATGFTLKVFL